MSERLNIEELFSSRLGKAEVQPSPGAWEAIQRKLRWKQFLRFRPGQLNIFYLGALLLTGTAVVTLVSTDPPGKQPAFTTEQSTDLPAQITGEPDRVRESAGAVSNRDVGITGEISAGKPETENAGGPALFSPGQEAALPQSSERGEKLPAGEGKAAGKATGKVADHTENPSEGLSSGPEERLRTQKTVVPYFTISCQSGCAPLTVVFRNQSIHESSSYWTFGNGEKITERNPVYRFTEPGRHIVTLTAEDSKGRIYTYRQVIEVFPSPKADFEIEEGLDGLDQLEVLSFMNYSAGAYSYSWTLLEDSEISKEKWSSDEFQPLFKRAGAEQETRYIRLLATNEYGCTDTSLQALPVTLGAFHPGLQYPTAFSPNPNGPGGGTYTPHEVRNDLFHPVFEAEPDEYLLTVYSRNGELVFKTRDIYQGWDGYYQQEQTSPGVYLWIAEGTWANGEEFRFRGDVTLLWGE